MSNERPTITVAQLIAALQKMPQDAEVAYCWDGYPRSRPLFQWLAVDGRVLLGDTDEYLYKPDHWPTDADPNAKVWHTPDV